MSSLLSSPTALMDRPCVAGIEPLNAPAAGRLPGARRVQAALVRAAVTVAGFVLLLVGAAMVLTPGPGLLVIIGGLALLATEYAWAARLQQHARARLARTRGRAATQAARLRRRVPRG